MTFTHKQYKAFEHGTAYQEEMNECVEIYNKKHNTKFRSQFEMIHLLYFDHDLSLSEIAKVFCYWTTKACIKYRLIDKMGLKLRGRGGYNRKRKSSR